MTPNERLQRRQQAMEFAAARAQQTLALKQQELVAAQFEDLKRRGATKGWSTLFTPTGAVVVAAALGLLGTAAGKWADYKINKRQQETAIILKVSEGVPQNISPEAQAVQRSRNLLWFSRANYIHLPKAFEEELEREAQLPKGAAIPSPIIEPLKTGLDLTESGEGFTPKVVQDKSGLKEVGFGHALTGEEVSSGFVQIAGQKISWKNGITQEQAAILLKQDMAKYLTVVDNLVKVSLTPCQRYALGDFVWNAGPLALKKSEFLERLNRGDYAAVPQLLPSTMVGRGRAIPGLVRRRQLEAALWSTPDHNEERCNIEAGRQLH